MRYLLLVRHAQTQLISDLPSNAWPLTEAGRRSCQPLAGYLSSYLPAKIITSTEPKAQETGSLAAEYLNLPWQSAPDLHEHERGNVRLLSSKAAFQAAVRRLFQQPNTLVFGQETAAQAQQRFSRAVANIIANQPAGNIIIVAHGTVISLFTAAHNEIDVIRFWQTLALPAVVIFALPQFKLLTVENTIHDA